MCILAYDGQIVKEKKKVKDGLSWFCSLAVRTEVSFTSTIKSFDIRYSLLKRDIFGAGEY